MGTETEVGRVIWHDLMTSDVSKAKRFYAELLGWEYQIEHATDFAWRPGEEADYPLILADGEAHGGLVDAGQDISSHWLAWVEVENVDATAAKAKSLGATIDQKPFDVPGVGRGAVIRDPQDAIICPFVPTYSFPHPGGTFLWNELITDDIESAKLFYGELFGWKTKDVDIGRLGIYTVFTRADDADTAGVMKRPLGMAGPAAWVTYVATNDVEETISRAEMLGASVRMKGTAVPSLGQSAVLTDVTGAVFGVLASGTTSES